MTTKDFDRFLFMLELVVSLIHCNGKQTNELKKNTRMHFSSYLNSASIRVILPGFAPGNMTLILAELR